MTLCEIQAFGSLAPPPVKVNIVQSPGVTAVGSSTLSGGWVASRAIDGNTNGNMDAGLSCWNSGGTTSPGDWLAINLQKVFYVGTVDTFMRTDGYQST